MSDYYDENTMAKVDQALTKCGYGVGDRTEIISEIQNAGILFRERSEEAIRPKEWIERQEEERRAWAINTSADIIKTADIWDEDSLINMAAKIEAFVKGSSDEDPDLHDQDAFDTWGLVTLELLSEVLFQKMTPDLANEQRDYIEDRLTDLSDALTKSGVRFKTGKVIED